MIYNQEHPDAEKKMQDTANQLLKKMFMDLVSDMNLINNKMTIYSISDKELIIGDSKKTYKFNRVKQWNAIIIDNYMWVKSFYYLWEQSYLLQES